ncbi:hypothetical protein GCM10008967_18450 [Bacillus carboniphilus]|uniref:Uncharacterized protein n=1 Tax=Bacillus carboniphilus TaxID=86663 RepID=A0ABP3FWF1_9BACI
MGQQAQNLSRLKEERVPNGTTRRKRVPFKKRSNAKRDSKKRTCPVLEEKEYQTGQQEANVSI